MNPEKDLNKTKNILYIICGIIAVLFLFGVYLIIINVKTAARANPQLVQGHTAQLNLEKFNEVLKNIKKQ